MKITTVLILSILMLSCENSAYKQGSFKTEPVKEKETELKMFLDKFILNHPDCFDNEIKNDMCSKMLIIEFFSFMTNDSINFLNEVEMRFEQMAPYPDGDYLVKFHHSSRRLRKISNSYDLTFQVFSKVNKEVAQNLIDGKKYTLSGNIVDYANKSSFVLPSGKWFIDFITIDKRLKSNSFVDEIIYINLGSLIIENLEFTRVWGEY
jgi:hypothetical protein